MGFNTAWTGGIWSQINCPSNTILPISALVVCPRCVVCSRCTLYGLTSGVIWYIKSTAHIARLADGSKDHWMLDDRFMIKCNTFVQAPLSPSSSRSQPSLNLLPLLYSNTFTLPILRRLSTGRSHRLVVELSGVLHLALLAVLKFQSSAISSDKARRSAGLTTHLADLSSVWPRRSAASLCSSFKLLRTARAATVRYLL